MKYNKKEIIKRFGQTVYRNLPESIRKFNGVILVSSYGRSGSTLLWLAICDAILPGHVLQKRLAALVEAGLWDPEESISKKHIGSVVKTHFRPSIINYDLNKSNIKNVYVICKPSESILSILHETNVQGDNWFKKHMSNLGAFDVSSPEQLINSDALNLEARMSDWSDGDIPSFIVKYENLWSCEDEVSNFLGFNVVLPGKRARREKHFDGDIVQQVQYVYSKIDKIYDSLPPFIITSTPKAK